MEAHLFHHGAIILKFWLHIDPETQLSRFTDRQNDPLKQYKITEEDWRNRAKWNEYEEHVGVMMRSTNTEHAPWTAVDSNNKKYARVKVLKTVVEALRKELNG
jgi:polyphosphate kinase 2 (PPK2 family)